MVGPWGDKAFCRRIRFTGPKPLKTRKREGSRVNIDNSFANISRSVKERQNLTLQEEKAAKMRPKKLLSRDVEECIARDRDFTVTQCIPVYVKLPPGFINTECELVDCDGLWNQLSTLESVNVDGVTVNVWWGIVEANNPKEYNWKGYKQLFTMVRDLGLDLQVVMSFHKCGDIPLPKWITEIGKENPDIYFADRDGRRNFESLTWGIDDEPVLKGRSAVEVYFEFMKSFRAEFDEFFLGKRKIRKIEIGLGASGELRYPSHSAKHGSERPGIGEFQCYDKYLKTSLENAAEATGCPLWGKPPDNVGSYNSQPEDTEFFCDGGGYASAHGIFFLKWYSQYLIDHGDRVLAKARKVFKGFPIYAKLSCIDWLYKTASHAAELTAGIYNLHRLDGYAPIASMLKKHTAGLNFAFADHPQELLLWQVRNAAWEAGIRLSTENLLPSYDFDKIVELTKPTRDPFARPFFTFTYHGLNQDLVEVKGDLLELKLFVKRMHGWC